MTKGEYRVGVDFNPGGSATVHDLKETAAALIDMVEDISPVRADTLASTDQGAALFNSEVWRLKALAQTAIEEGAMWAVKAATKKPR